MIGHVAAIGALEFRIGLRNRWVVLATAILTLFALALGFLGSGATGTVDATPLKVAVASLATLSVYLVPLIALVLTFDAIAGEVERGTLPLILATPVDRAAIVLGKFAGHLAVLATAVVVGYGIAGALIVALSGETGGLAHLVRLIATSIALGAVFLGLGYAVSAAVRQTGTAAAVAVGIWLVAVVLYDLALLGALVADGEGVFARDLFPWFLIGNPADAFRLYNMATLDLGADATGLTGTAAALPYPPAAALLSLALWLAATLGLATLLLERLEP